MIGKKRRRPAAADTARPMSRMEKKTELTLDALPRLKGVPLYLSPLVWDAIRATRSYYYRVPNAPCLTTTTTTCFSFVRGHPPLPVDERQSQEAHHINDENDDDVTESILRRFAQSNSSSVGIIVPPTHHDHSSEEERATIKYRKAALDATKAIVDGIRTHVLREGNHNTQPKEDHSNHDHHTATDPVVTACFHHLWEKCTTVVPATGRQHHRHHTDTTPKQRLRQIAGWRAGLFLARELLLRSKDCRATIATGSSSFDGGSSSDFLTNVMEHTPTLPTTTTTTAQITRVAQREAVQLLELLATRYGHTHYPCMVVAHVGLMDRLAARGIIIQTDASVVSFQRSHARNDHDYTTSTTTTTATTMGRLRQQRDAALRYGDKEYNKVQRLVQRADACFPILMPRFAYQNTPRFTRLTPPPPNPTDVNIMNSENTIKDTSVDGSNVATATATADEVNIDSWHEEDDNDSVDWEDGATQEDSELDHKDHQSMEDSYENHEAAVERTLAVMQNENGTGILTDGGLDIDFSSSTAVGYEDATTMGNYPPKNDKDEAVLDSTTMEAGDVKRRAYQVLNKCVHRLRERHMPRLARYMEGLVAADSMTFSNNTASLVLLPDETRRQRAVLLQKLMDIKGAVATVLSLATRVESASSSTTTVEQQDGTHTATYDSSILTGTTSLLQKNIATASLSSGTMRSITPNDGLAKPKTLATTKTACHDDFHDEMWSMEHSKRHLKVDKNKSSIKDRLWISSLRQTGGSKNAKPFKRHASIGRNKLQIKYRKS